MLTRFILLLPAVALGMACATVIPLAPMPSDHPASPQGPEAPAPPPSQTLRKEPQDAAHSRPPEPGMHRMESPELPRGHEHGTGAKQGDGDLGTGSTAHMPEDTLTLPPKAASGTHAETFYTCPMHPEVRRDQPGTCPKCGMKLVKKEGAQ